MGEIVQVRRPDGSTCPAYLSTEKLPPSAPGLVVIQEWWGVDEHIKDLTARFAGQGFAALAPDLYRGKVAKEPSEAQKLVMQVQMDQAMKDIQGAVDYLIGQDYVAPKKAGIVGFCYGGGIAMRMSYLGKNVGAVVVFYGAGVDPSDDDLKNVSAPLLGLYGGKDTGITQEHVEAMRKAIAASGKKAEIVIYPDVGHAFNADYRPSYNKEAAEDGWKRMLAFFKANGVA